MTQVANFDIHYSAYLGSKGEILQPLPEGYEDTNTLTDLYRWMLLTRSFDAKAVALQRTGRLGTYASSLGQEAVGVGIGHAMRHDDVLLPSFREHGAQLYRGVRIEELLLYWGGDERGSDFSACPEDFPVCVTVGGHAPHAAGVALAFKLRGEERAAVCVMGDGATSKGDVYEAMNLAGVWQLPVVFVVSNNQWAISTRRDEQTGAATLAQKAIACGFEGEQVDGNDIIAVSHAIAQALGKARAGGGPHLVECLTYRLADHTTSDDATRYRDDAEVSRWWQQDPISRLRIYLTHETRLLDDCNNQVEAATEKYLQMPPQDPASMFNYLYAELPVEVQRQREEMLRTAQGGVSDHG